MSFSCFQKAFNCTIPSYRLNYIQTKVEEFKSIYINQYPVDCGVLLDKIQESNSQKLIIASVGDISEDIDILTLYALHRDTYIILVNSRKYSVPFKCSNNCWLNFLTAREIGHIVLAHLLVPEYAKTEVEKQIEQAEASEFAVRMLLPDESDFSSAGDVQVEAVRYNVPEDIIYRGVSSFKDNKKNALF